MPRNWVIGTSVLLKNFVEAKATDRLLTEGSTAKVNKHNERTPKVFSNKNRSKQVCNYHFMPNKTDKTSATWMMWSVGRNMDLKGPSVLWVEVKIRVALQRIFLDNGTQINCQHIINLGFEFLCRAVLFVWIDISWPYFFLRGLPKDGDSFYLTNTIMAH